MYQIKKESQFKQKYDKDSYLESIQRANQVVRSEHLQKKTMHEFKLNQLNDLEERLIGEL